MMRHKGSALILVLWVVIILSLLSIAISFRTSGDIKLARYESESIKAMCLAKAGVIKAVAGLNKDMNNYDSLNEDWNFEKGFRFGGAIVLYNALDEEARLNLNSADLKKENLLRLGLDDIISQRILDYRVKKAEKGFEFIEELFLIDGMTQDIYSTIEPYVTIYKGNRLTVNINTAKERVLYAVLEDEVIANKILEYRSGNDGKEGTEDDAIFRDENFSLVFKDFGITPDEITRYQNLFSVKSNFFRTYSNVSFSEDKRIVKRVSCVVDRTGKINYWKED